MKKIVEILKKSYMFRGINENDIEEMLNCLEMKIKNYRKGSYIYNIGDIIDGINMLADGMAHIVKEDYWGNKSILTEINEGELFGETYACLKALL